MPFPPCLIEVGGWRELATLYGMKVSSVIQTSKPKELSWVGTLPSPTPAQTRLLPLPSWLPLLTATRTAGWRRDDPFTTQQTPCEHRHPGPAFQPGLDDFPHFSTTRPPAPSGEESLTPRATTPGATLPSTSFGYLLIHGCLPGPGRGVWRC